VSPDLAARLCPSAIASKMLATILGKIIHGTSRKMFQKYTNNPRRKRF
jgi:hypothetical protein